MASGQIHGEPFQIRQRTISERPFVSGPENNTRCLVDLKGFLRARSAKAPSVAGLKTRKAEFRHRRRQIIASRFRELKKFSRHDDANRVTPHIFFGGIATAVTIKASHRSGRTNLQRLP